MDRSSHAAYCLNYGEEQPQLLVTGGLDKNGKTLQDAWILDINSGRWREVSGDESHHEYMVQLLESAARLYFNKIIVYIGMLIIALSLFPGLPTIQFVIAASDQ